jgi:hypothetical protein
MRIIAIDEGDFFERILAEMQWADDGGNVVVEIDYLSVPEINNPNEPLIDSNTETDSF